MRVPARYTMGSSASGKLEQPDVIGAPLDLRVGATDRVDQRCRGTLFLERDHQHAVQDDERAPTQMRLGLVPLALRMLPAGVVVDVAGGTQRHHLRGVVLVMDDEGKFLARLRCDIECASRAECA